MHFPEGNIQNDAVGTVPARTIDELLELIPQEVAVNQGRVKRVGEITLVSCRDFTDEDAERLDSLTHRQYQSLLLASEALPYTGIGTGLGLTRDTARDHLEESYRKLGGSSKFWATTFIPIEKTLLRGLPPYRPDAPSTKNGRLSLQFTLPPRQLQIFHGLGDGLLQDQIANKLGISDSSLRTHVLHLRRRLGVSATISLIRMAGATKNLNLSRWDSGDSPKPENL